MLNRAQILVEALPYIRAFSGKTIVIKYGGKAMTEPKLKEQFAEDIVLLKYVGINPIVVHGGGPQISQVMERLGKKPRFVKGVRVTDAETMEVVEMVLCGTINKEIVSLINRHGGKGVGLTGKDGALLRARKAKGDMGFVGEIETVDPQILGRLDAGRFIPVIAPVAAGADGHSYNINADTAASAIASALLAEKLILLTDVSGVYDRSEKLISSVTRREALRLIKRGVVSEGMVPKVNAAIAALEGGVRKAHILDGRIPHVLLLELFTAHGVGTEIVA